jgi:uridylate kinase
MKATKVDGIYDADPVTHPEAKKFDTITYKEVLAGTSRSWTPLPRRSAMTTRCRSWSLTWDPWRLQERCVASRWHHRHRGGA